MESSTKSISAITTANMKNMEYLLIKAGAPMIG